MYEAYSKKIKSIINISYALKHPDREEHYKCPNPSCDTEFYPKALKNCNVRPHFCRYKTTLHVVGCPYALENPNYHDTKISDKYSLEDILSNHAKSAGTAVSTQFDNFKGENRSSRNIHTPRQLLNYCVSNSLDTVYLNELTVNDIIVDARNINNDDLILEFNGIKLLIGTTVCYNPSKNYLLIRLENPITRESLSAKIFVNKTLLKEIKSYIFSVKNIFKGHMLAVLANWKQTDFYFVEAHIEKSTQIIYKF